MIEPAAYGVALSFGPNTWNFRAIVSGLLSAKAAVVVKDQAELAAFIQKALADLRWREELGSRARQFVMSQQGASDQTIKLLEELMAPEKMGPEKDNGQLSAAA